MQFSVFNVTCFQYKNVLTSKFLITDNVDFIFPVWTLQGAQGKYGANDENRVRGPRDRRSRGTRAQKHGVPKVQISNRAKALNEERLGSSKNVGSAQCA